MVGLFFVTMGCLFITNPTSQSAVGWKLSRKSYIFNLWMQNSFDSEKVFSQIRDDKLALSMKQLDGSRFLQFLGNMTFKVIGLCYFVVGMMLMTTKSKNVAMFALIFHIIWCILSEGNYWLVKCDPYEMEERFGLSLLFKQFACLGCILMYSINSRAREDSVANLFGYK